MSNASHAADQFLNEEQQFRLRVLTTEQPHPKTAQLSQTIQRNTVAGIRTLLEIDHDILPVATRVSASDAYQQMASAFIRALDHDRTICFSGCGASGRSAIILEAMWKSFWQNAAERFPDRRARYLAMAERVISLMTGGDRALIRSVENFEDYQVFGRRQVQDVGLSRDDVLVAMSEDGVISSVIGTAKEALARQAQVFLIYNNPRQVLVEHFQRSRDVIEDSRIIQLELTTGNMALTGSTRLQATSIATLLIGTAMEQALATWLARENPAYLASVQTIPPDQIPSTYLTLFKDLLRQLAEPSAVAGIARAVDVESATYAQHGLVTYVAEQYLLDIFSDTTERTPTFTIPPFHPADDLDAPEPWAFARDLMHPTPAAWQNLLRRPPRAIEWTRADYSAMQAHPSIIEHPPRLGTTEILKFQIGNEDYPARHAAPHSTLMWVSIDGASTDAFTRAYLAQRQQYARGVLVTLGADAFALPDVETIHIPFTTPPTSCALFKHLAVKLIFNVLSTGTMGKLDRIVGNWMVQVYPTNKKLIDRSVRIIQHLSGLSYEEACHEFFITLEQPANPSTQFQESPVVLTLKRLGIALGGKDETG